MSFQSYLNKDNKELQKGIEVEREHKDLYDYFNKFLKKHNIKMPLSEDEFFGKIAKSHINELPDYYERLDKMEKDK